MDTTSDSSYRKFNYSADGNLTEKVDKHGDKVNSMTYDSQGKLTGADGTTFVYDHNGRLVKVTRMDGSVTYYVSEFYELDIASDKTTTKTSYIFHQSSRRASYADTTDRSNNVATKVQYYHHDHLGSVVAVSDSSGSIVTTYSYNPFGEITISGTDISRYKFSGKEQFGTLYYFGARFYDSEVSKVCDPVD